MKIAIIDESINEYSLTNINIKSYVVTEDLEVCKSKLDTSINKHAYICTKIIADTASNNEYHCIKILDNFKKAEISKMRIALEWCLKNEMEIINLSIGSSYSLDYEALIPVIRMLVNNNTPIISACNNNNTLTIPASIKGVIGVRCDPFDMLLPGSYIYDENNICGIDLTVGSLESQPPYRHLNLKKYNSFAAPFITGVVSNIMHSGIVGLENIKYVLQENSSLERYNYIHECNAIKNWIQEFPLTIEISNSSEIIIELTNQMRCLGYNAICITDYPKEHVIFCYSDYLYNKDYSYYEYLLLVNNVARPDIIFIAERKNNLEINYVIDLKLKLTDGPTCLPSHFAANNTDNLVININKDQIYSRIVANWIGRVFT